MRNKWLFSAVYALSALLTGNAFGQTVYFSTADVGQDKAITEWGVEVVQGSKSYNTARLYKGWLGEDGLDVFWSFFWPGAALDGSGNLAQEHMDVADNFIDGDWTTLFPNASWGFGPNINDTDAYFFPGNTFDSTRWYTLIKKHVEYYESRGQTVAHMMPFNEADFWAGQGSPYDLAAVAQLLADDSSLDGMGIMGPSTLSSGNAYNDYTAFGSGGASGPLTHGSTHHLQWYDSAAKISDFYTYDVLAHGDIPYNPELHALGEAIFSAEYGCRGGAWWADPVALLPRAMFMESCKGARLGYAENRGAQSADTLTQSAAAVYRAPDGELYGFAGGFERQGVLGSMNNYRFVSTDRDVYFNGIGPIREYVLPVRQAQDAFITIEYGTDRMPALDGHRWKIVSRYTGHVLGVLNDGSADGDDVQTTADTGALSQRWNIIRNKDGYFKVFNAHSGKALDVNGDALWDGANVHQWTFVYGFNQYWCVEKSGNGYFHIRGANSTLYLDGAGTSTVQGDADGGTWQEWQFVLDDPVGSGTPAAAFAFDGDAGGGTASGAPAFVEGLDGSAIDLDGTNDFVTLPGDVANVDDITVAAWVNWDGGSAQQRIFDFGNDTTNYFFLTPSDGNGQMRCSITTGSYKYEDSLITDSLPVGQWAHVAVTLCGNTGILYVNGAPKVAGVMSLNPSDFNPTHNLVGDSQWGGDPLFNGQMDDFMIYDYALDAAAVSNLVAASAPTNAPPAEGGGAVGVISWNIDWGGTVGTTGANGVAGSNDLAGVVEAGFWNNSWDGAVNDFNRSNLTDSEGNGTTLDVVSTAQWGQHNNDYNGQDANGTWNRNMLTGYLNGSSTGTSIAISQIPYETYDLYVYFMSDVADREGSVSDGTSTFYYRTFGNISGGTAAVNGSGNAFFARATETVDVAQNSLANYAVFSNLTGTARTVSTLSADGAGIAGFQLVQVAAPVEPEEYVISAPAVAGGTLFMTVSNSVAGHQYILLETDSLTPPLWTTNVMEAGTGSNILFDIPMTATNRFFKLDVERQ